MLSIVKWSIPLDNPAHLHARKIVILKKKLTVNTSILVQHYLKEDKKLYVDFMDLKKAYDKVDREALWSVLKICDVGG